MKYACNAQLRGWHQTAIALSLMLSAVACKSTPATAPANTTTGGTQQVASLDLDGLLLMRAQDANYTQIHLLDPATGKTSALQAVINLVTAPVAVSPDGRRVAWIGLPQADGLPPIIVAEPELENGVPIFHITRVFSGTNARMLRWNLQGDRLLTSHLSLNPATGDISDCTAKSPTQDEATIYPPWPLPDGHLFTCPLSSSLMDDGRRVANASGTGETMSADGQWYFSDLHVPTWTNRPLGKNEEIDQFFSKQNLKFALPDARWGFFLPGVTGLMVVEEGSVQGSSVYVKKVKTFNDPQVDGETWDVRDSFVDDKHTAAGKWKFAGVLEEFLHGGDGRGWSPRAVSGDGQKMVWQVNTWRIAYDPKSGEPYNQLTDTVLAEVAQDGTKRAFHLSDVGAAAVAQVELAPTLSRRLELPGGDWLLPTGGGDSAWVGYLDGKPAWLDHGGVLAHGGTRLLGVGPFEGGTWTVCMRTLDGGQIGASRCVPQPQPGVPIAVVGQGRRTEHAGDPPLILALNRRAAWTGSTVRIDGAHLGTSGKLTVGDVEVPKSAIGLWSDTAIEVTMTTALPVDGVLQVTTAAGTGGQTQQFRIARTEPWSSPFAKVTRQPQTVKQGLNVLDLGDLGSFPGAKQADLVVEPAAKRSDGKYVVWSLGASPEETRELTLSEGPYRFVLPFTLQNATSTVDPWQLIGSLNGDLGVQHPAFVTMAGDLIERQSATHPIVGARTLFRTAASLTGQGTGLPAYWQEVPGGALTTSHVDGMPADAGWVLQKITGWTGTDGLWGTAQFAKTPTASLPNYFRHAVADGDTIVAVGADPLGTSGAAWQISTDGGKTFGKTQVAGPEVLGSQGLLFPMMVHAKSGTFVLAFDGVPGAPTVGSVHALGLDGTLIPDVAYLPPDGSFGAVGKALPEVTTLGDQSRALVHFRAKQTLAMIDFDAPGSEPHDWSVLPSPAAKGHVLSFWHDPQTHDLVVVLDDGQVQRATAASGWTQFAPVDLGIQLSLPTVVKPLAMGKMADGRWIVLARLFQPDGTTPSPLGINGWLIGNPN